MTTNETAGVMVSEDWGFVTGMCPAMQTLESVVAEIAPTNIPVLFLGESGTGKAMFAQRLHRLSARCDEPAGYGLMRSNGYSTTFCRTANGRRPH